MVTMDLFSLVPKTVSHAVFGDQPWTCLVWFRRQSPMQSLVTSLPPAWRIFGVFFGVFWTSSEQCVCSSEGQSEGCLRPARSNGLSLVEEYLLRAGLFESHLWQAASRLKFLSVYLSVCKATDAWINPCWSCKQNRDAKGVRRNS